MEIPGSLKNIVFIGFAAAPARAVFSQPSPRNSAPAAKAAGTPAKNTAPERPAALTGAKLPEAKFRTETIAGVQAPGAAFAPAK